MWSLGASGQVKYGLLSGIGGGEGEGSLAVEPRCEGLQACAVRPTRNSNARAECGELGRPGLLAAAADRQQHLGSGAENNHSQRYASPWHPRILDWGAVASSEMHGRCFVDVDLGPKAHAQQTPVDRS